MRSLSVSEAGAVLGVSAETVRRWADGGVLPCRRFPSGYRRFGHHALVRFRDELRAGLVVIR